MVVKLGIFLIKLNEFKFMQRTLLFFLFFMVVISADAQEDPVRWTFTVNRVSDKIYELHLRGTVEKGWHLFSTVQPEDAIPMPTKINFKSNPMVSFLGKIREVGNVKNVKEPALGTSSNQYENSVDFVQTVKRNKLIKTNILGSVNFQTCTNGRCLSPKLISFNLAIE